MLTSVGLLSASDFGDSCLAPPMSRSLASLPGSSLLLLLLLLRSRLWRL